MYSRRNAVSGRIFAPGLRSPYGVLTTLFVVLNAILSYNAPLINLLEVYIVIQKVAEIIVSTFEIPHCNSLIVQINLVIPPSSKNLVHLLHGFAKTGDPALLMRATKMVALFK